MFGDPETTTRQITDIVTSIGPSSAAQTFAGPIESITSNRSAAGILLIVGLATALWSASGYVGAFIRASNVVWETPEGRGFFKLRPLQLAVTLLMIILFAVVALSLVLTGPIVEAVGDSIGVGDTALTIWDIAKWPVLLGVVIIMIAMLYYASPNVKLPGFKFVTPGSLVAVVIWLIASAAFALYVANFGSYDKTYGPSAASSRCSFGSRSRTSRCSSVWSSTRSESAAANSRPACRGPRRDPARAAVRTRRRAHDLARTAGLPGLVRLRKGAGGKGCPAGPSPGVSPLRQADHAGDGPSSCSTCRYESMPVRAITRVT